MGDRGQWAGSGQAVGTDVGVGDVTWSGRWDGVFSGGRRHQSREVAEYVETGGSRVEHRSNTY